jgi:putative addiction module killer protein
VNYKLQWPKPVIEVRRFQCVDGAVPITEWLATLRDARVRAKLEIRFSRAALGLLGDIKSVGGGVLEMRENVGPGYRVYCAQQGQALVILFCGGDKSSQADDIERAKKYWLDWKRRNR